MCLPSGAVVASSIAAIASTAGVVIAVINSRAQRREHAERLRADLYPRRLATFNSALSFYNAVLVWTNLPEEKAARDSFMRAYQESGFLFTPKSGIENLFKQLYEEGNRVIGYKQSREALRGDPATSNRLFLESHEIMMGRFPDAFDKLKTALAPYLNFHDVANTDH
jgi:hypothetical protein